MNATELRALAEKALAGPWVSERSISDETDERGLAVIAVIPEHEKAGHATPTRGMVAWIYSGRGACVNDDEAIATGRHIAACDPQTILALLDRAERAEAEAARLREALGPLASIGELLKDDKKITDTMGLWSRQSTIPGREFTLTVGDARRARAALNGDAT